MKNDYSEYQYTQYDKYRLQRGNRKNIKLDFFHNSIRFHPEERNFRIYVDDLYEYYSMDDLIEEATQAQEARLGKKLSRVDFPEEEAEHAQNRIEHEAENQELLQRMSQKYQIDRSYADHEREQHYRDNEAVTVEPLINIFSGASIVMNYGEGILDFIYADFLTPINEDLPLYVAFTSVKKRNQESSSSKEQSSQDEKTKKVYNHTQELVDDFFAYYMNFSSLQDVIYASLYSAICPPKIDGVLSISDEIRWYGTYLLELQAEYKELIEFCFDESFYPGALGKLHPAERFCIYRQYKDLPTISSRRESVTFSTRKMSERFMPYGLESSDLIKRITATPEQTDDHIALAQKLGMTTKELVWKTHVPHFMNIQYNFSSVAEILELEFTKMLEANVRFRKCKRCGKYFIMKGKYDTNYCDRVAEGETRNCQELAAAENYKAKIAGDKAIPVYNKYYKRYAARVRVKQIKEADFKKWKYQAIALRDDCSAGKITVEEYIQWMEDSFPNRKPKT